MFIVNQVRKFAEPISPLPQAILGGTRTKVGGVHVIFLRGHFILFVTVGSFTVDGDPL